LEKIIEQLNSANAETELLNEFFWRAARLEFPELIGKSSIAVRENFTLVWNDESEEDQVSSLLHNLLARAFASRR